MSPPRLLAQITFALFAICALSLPLRADVISGLTPLVCEDEILDGNTVRLVGGISIGAGGHALIRTTFPDNSAGIYVVPPTGGPLNVAQLPFSLGGGTVSPASGVGGALSSGGDKVMLRVAVTGIPNVLSSAAVLSGSPGSLAPLAWEGADAGAISPGAVYDQITDVHMNSGGQVSYKVKLDDQIHAIVLDGMPVIKKGETYPELRGVGRFSELATTSNSRVWLNDGGDLLFDGQLVTGGEVTNSNNSAVFLRQGASIEEVATEGSAAPGVGGTYGTLEGESFATGGWIGLTGGVSGPEIDFTNDQCVWVGQSGAMQLVVREGDSVPLPSGGTLPLFVLPSSGAVRVAATGSAVIRGSMDSRGDGVGLDFEQGIWYWNGGGLIPLLREGAPFQGNANRIVNTIGTPIISPAGVALVSVGLLDPGTNITEVVLLATDSDGSNLRVVIGYNLDQIDLGGDGIRLLAAASVAAVNARNEVLLDLSLVVGPSLDECAAILDLGGGLIGSISGEVRLDSDGDGDLSDNDSGMPNVTVSLTPVGGGTPVTTSTDPNGIYSFGNLDPGNYAVEVVPPAGFGATADHDGGDAQIISAAVNILPLNNRDFLLRSVPADELTVRVLIDSNGDGDASDANLGLAGVEVQMFDRATGGEASPEIVTDANGLVTFTGLSGGPHAVSAYLGPRPPLQFGTLADQGYRWTSPTDARDKSLLLLDVNLPNPSPLILLVTKYGTISGLVQDADNLPNGLPNARVRLLNASDDSPVEGTSSVTTDASGAFSFTDLFPGSYVLEEDDPPGYESASDNGIPFANDNRIPVELSSGADSNTHEFRDRLGVYSISLHRVLGAGVSDPGALPPVAGPFPPINPILPVSDRATLQELPFVTDGLVADGVTPLLIKVAAQNLSDNTDRTFRWTCELDDTNPGGSITGGIYSHMRDRLGGVVGAPFNVITVNQSDPCEFAVIQALAPEQLQFAAGSTQINLVFKMLADDLPKGSPPEVLAEKPIALRRPPVLLLADEFAPPWGPEVLDELKAIRPADFLFPQAYSSPSRSGVEELGEGDLTESWAVTRFDCVAHGRQMLFVREDLRRFGYRSASNEFRGFLRRIVAVGSPNNGTRLTPYLKELNNRLRSLSGSNLIQFLPSSALQLPAWDILNNDSSLSVPRDLDPRSSFFNRRREYDPSAGTFHVSSLVSTDSLALKQVGLGNSGRRGDVLPSGFDGLVDTASPRAATQGNANHESLNSFSAHSDPISLFEGAAAHTRSSELGVLLRNRLDAPDTSTDRFLPYRDPRPKLNSSIESIVAAAQSVPAPLIVDIVSNAPGKRRKAGGGGVVIQYPVNFTPPPTQPVTGEVFWFVELHGKGSASLAGVSVLPDPADPTSATVSVSSAVCGDVVLFASYETNNDQIAFAHPRLVVSQPPLGVPLHHIELLPGEITLQIGDTIRPDIVAVYEDGTRLTKWLTTADITSMTSSNPSIVSTADVPAWEAVGPGSATISVTAFGLSAQSTVTVDPPPPPLTFEAWRATVFTTAQLADPNISGDEIDLDGDQLNTLFEFITGGDPILPNPEFYPSMEGIEIGGQTEIAFRVRISKLIDGQIVIVQHSSDLEVWDDLFTLSGTPDLTQLPVLDFIEGDSYREVFFETSGAARSFYRLAVDPDPSGIVTGTTELPFTGVSFGPLSTDYADRVASTTTGGYSYGGDPGFTPNIETYFTSTLQGLNPYADLTDVVRQQNSAPMTIEFLADLGHAVRLESFDLAGDFAPRSITLIEARDIEGQLLWSEADGIAPFPIHAHYDFTGLQIQSDALTLSLSSATDATRIGLDNLRLSQIQTTDLGNWTLLTFANTLPFGSQVQQSYGDRVAGFLSGGHDYLGGGTFTPGIVASYSPVGGARYSFGHPYIVTPLRNTQGETTPLIVTLTADPGQQVRLFGFDMARLPHVTGTVAAIQILDGTGTELVGFTDVELSPKQSRFDFTASPPTADEIVIRIDATSLGGDARNIGLSRILFGQVPAP